MSTALQDRPRRYRLTVEQFHRMGDAGLFAPNDRVELVDGELLDLPPIGSLHAGALHRLAALLTNAFGTQAAVRQQSPVRLSEHAEPLPDIAVVKTRRDDYMASHPTGDDCLLVVEISDTTLRYDLDVKAALYARFGVPEVWVVALQQRELHRFRSATQGGCSDVRISELGRLTVDTVPEVAVDLTRLLG